MITVDLLQDVMPTLSQQKAAVYAPLLEKWTARFGMTDPVILAMFLAQIAEESGELTRWRENMNYSTPERLVHVWPARFNHNTAKAYVGQPQKLANLVYGNRKELGNREPNDGWNYRGGGPLQATGRDMYQLLTEAIGEELGIDFVAEPNRITEPEAGIASACWIWAVEKRLNEIARSKGTVQITLRGRRMSVPPFTAVTYKINGGTTNLEKRDMYWERAKKALGVKP